MNILIVGLGNIGFAHLKSFFLSKKKYSIDLYDKKKIKFDSLILKKKNQKKINILKKLPQNNTYNIVIIATNSLERFEILKKIIKNNKIGYFLLEKMIFTKIAHYDKSKYFTKNHANNIFVNVWGSLIVKLLNIMAIKKNPPIQFKAKIKEGRFITNLVHYIDMFCALTEKKIDFNIMLNKIFDSKRKPYKEASGRLSGFNNLGNILIESDPNIVTDTIIIKNRKDTYKILINKNKSIFYFKNSKLIKKIKFPFAYLFTYKIFENYMIKNKKNSIIKNFNFVSLISREIVKKIEKIKIT